MEKVLVGLIMGSISDWEYMKGAAEILEDFDIPYEKKVVSAHRTPELMYEYAKSAKDKGLEVIIAGAGGAAHLPGMVASLTTIPVIGVPVPSRHLKGVDSLYSIVQMPAGIPVATVAIGNSTNAGLLAASILANKYPEIDKKLQEYRAKLKEKVLNMRFTE